MNTYKIPYGISDFSSIVKEQYVYVDKTNYIEELEKLNTKYPVFLRPRRFGKSLFVSTLFYYYDRNSADQFAELFSNTYIGKYKTDLANKYYVLRFEFAGLQTDDEETLREAFYQKIDGALRRFINYYKLDIKIKENTKHNAASMLNYFFIDLEQKIESPVYVLIDEYDHFSNSILQDKEFFQSITSKDGFVRSFYEVFKAHTDGCIDRIFITGVTPVTLDSLTSGFNIAKNVSMNKRLQQMVGFTKDETRGLLEKMQIDDIHSILKLMEEQYNGYSFTLAEENENRVFNSNLVLYFLDEYMEQEKIPAELIDANIRSDYRKLTGMLELFEEEDRRRELLESIMLSQQVETDIVTNFDTAVIFGENEFLSMLYYLGLLTIKGEGKYLRAALTAPNTVIRDVYYLYYANYLQINDRERGYAVADIARNDNFNEMNQLVSKVLRLHSNDDYRGFDEARLKSIYLSCLSDQNYFLVKSEYESEGKKIDIGLFDSRSRKNGPKYNYLIELKYIKKAKASEALIENIRQDAIVQMQNYLKLAEFSGDDRLKGIVYIVVKDKIVYFEEVS